MARKLNLTVDQGTTFSYTIFLNDANGAPQDLSSFTGRAQMRKHYASTTSKSFTVAVGVNGTVTMSMNASSTTNTVPGRYVYDLELVNGSVVTRLAEGIITVTPEVTK